MFGRKLSRLRLLWEEVVLSVELSVSKSVFEGCTKSQDLSRIGVRPLLSSHAQYTQPEIYIINALIAHILGRFTALGS